MSLKGRRHSGAVSWQESEMGNVDCGLRVNVLSPSPVSSLSFGRNHIANILDDDRVNKMAPRSLLARSS